LKDIRFFIHRFSTIELRNPKILAIIEEIPTIAKVEKAKLRNQFGFH
jgi:hypothetical protein